MRQLPCKIKRTKLTLFQSALKKPTCTGWKISVTGVFQDSFGGVTEFQLGITNKQARYLLDTKHLQISKIGSRIKTYWILGSVLHYGRFQRWAGQMLKQRTSSVFSQPMYL